MLSLKTHSWMDYVIAAVLLVSPYVFGFSQVASATNVFLTLGVILIGYSLLTAYRYSLAKLIPVPIHMFLDTAIGVFLILAPSLVGYRPFITLGQYVLHFVLGIGTIAFVALTNTGRTRMGRVGQDIPTIERRRSQEDRRAA